MSQGARILLRILREEMAETKGAAVLQATLGNKLKSQWNQYRTGCLKELVQELTAAGVATRGLQGESTATLSLSRVVEASRPRQADARTPYPI